MATTTMMTTIKIQGLINSAVSVCVGEPTIEFTLRQAPLLSLAPLARSPLATGRVPLILLEDASDEP